MPPATLIAATLVRRYQRFLADVRLADGTIVTVHCPNSGSMRTCCEVGAPVALRDAASPTRKLRYSLEMIRMGRTWVALHSAQANDWAEGLWRARRLPDLRGYRHLRREVRCGPGTKSRIDLVLESSAGGRHGRAQPPCWVEVKLSTMRVGVHAAFPDAVTERGRRHLEDLVAKVRAGERAGMLFILGRADCLRFRPADEIDPEYGRTLRWAAQEGVSIWAYRLGISPRGRRPLGLAPVDLGELPRPVPS